MDWWSGVERMATHVEPEEDFGRKCAEEREGKGSERISRAEMVV